MAVKTLIFEALFICIIMLQWTLLSAQLKESLNSQSSQQSVRITRSSNANEFATNYQPVTSNIGLQKNSFIYSTGANGSPGSSANVNIFPSFNNFPPPVSSNAFTTASSNFKYGVPNAFTAAALNIPSIQRFLTYTVPGYEAAELLFKVSDQRLVELGNPNHATYANLVAHSIVGIDYFTIPLYFQARGNVIEKFLVAEGIEPTPDLPQRYADSIETALSSRVIDSPETLHRLIIDGSSNFLGALGFTHSDKSYIASLYLHEELVRFRNL